MSDTTTVRLAPTIHRWRLAEPSDIKAGQEFQMIELDWFDDKLFIHNPAIVGTTIRLDENPVRRRTGFPGAFVYFHCVKPAWDGQCLVSAEDFLKMDSGRPRTFSSRTGHYWLPMD